MEKRINFVKVKFKDYKSYLEKNGNDQLDRWNRISTDSKPNLVSKIFKTNEEIFNGIETDYHIEKYDNGEILIKFESNSGNQYRFDLMKELESEIYHIAFSKYDIEISSYENLTNDRESLEIFNKLIWILKDVSKKLNISEFCIGMTGNSKKDRIYEYMMRMIDEWEKKECDDYPSGWAIYFKL